MRFAACASVILRCLLLWNSTIGAQQSDRTLNGRIAAGESHSLEVQSGPGDLIVLTVSVKRTDSEAILALSANDSAGRRIKTARFASDSTSPISFSFVVPNADRHRVIVGALLGGLAYTIRLETRTPKQQVGGAQVMPRRMAAQSPKMARFMTEVRSDANVAVQRFWSDVESNGAPLVESIEGNDREVLVTFLWRQTFETHNVLVLWPGVPPDRSELEYMTHVTGTPVWYLTVKVAAGSRFSYSLAPNDGGRSPHLTEQVDPLNRRSAIARSESVLETPGAPDESWFRRTPRSSGTITSRQFESKLIGGPRDVLIYTPHGYSPDGGPYPLVLLFDGTAYARTVPSDDADLDHLARIGAPSTFDNLIEAGRIRPALACFVTYGPGSTRSRDLNHPAYDAAIATELLPWIRSNYAVSSDARDVVIGGYSAGGGAAARIAHGYPSSFGNVLMQSGGVFVLASRYFQSPAVPVRLYMDIGSLEWPNPGPIARDEVSLGDIRLPTVAIARHARDVLRAKNYDFFHKETGGGHQDIHWRATLAEGLMALLARDDRK